MVSIMTRNASILVLTIMALLMGVFTVSANIDPTVIFSFNNPGEAGQATVVNDDVMGGISNSRWMLTPKGTGVFSGVVSLENNGGFASLRLHPNKHKLTGYTGLEIRLKGDGKKYQFTLKQGRQLDGIMYQKTLSTKAGRWQVVRIAFDQFLPTYRGRRLLNMPPFNLANAGSIGVLIADNQAGPFRLELDWVKVYTAK